MKKILLIIVGLLLPALCFSQFTSPESIAYYPKENFYLVSNAGAGTISKYINKTDITQYAAGLTQPKGLCVVGDVLYVADVTKLVAIDLQTGNKLFSIPITGSQFLNDICTDGDGYLYITDTQMNSIFKFNISTQEFYTLQLKGSVPAPNGIIYKNGKLMGVSFMTSSPIWEIDLSTNTVKVLKTTNYNYLDGIQWDGKGTIYISAWNNTSQSGAGAIYSINEDFIGDFGLVSDKLSGPADIFYMNGDLLFIPEMNANKVTVLNFNSIKVEKKIINLPSNGELLIPKEILPPYTVEIYNLNGNMLYSEQTGQSGIKLNLANGTYFIRINETNYGKVLVNK